MALLRAIPGVMNAFVIMVDHPRAGLNRLMADTRRPTPHPYIG